MMKFSSVVLLTLFAASQSNAQTSGGRRGRKQVRATNRRRLDPDVCIDEPGTVCDENLGCAEPDENAICTYKGKGGTPHFKSRCLTDAELGGNTVGDYLSGDETSNSFEQIVACAACTCFPEDTAGFSVKGKGDVDDAEFECPPDEPSSSPTIADDCFCESGETKFVFAPQLLTWEQHRVMAESKKCVLASVRDATEQAILQSLLPAGQPAFSFVWLGGVATDAVTDSSIAGWAWIDGSPYSYENFDEVGSGEPTSTVNAGDEPQYLLAMYNGATFSGRDPGEWVNSAPTEPGQPGGVKVQNFKAAFYRCCTTDLGDIQDFSECPNIEV